MLGAQGVRVPLQASVAFEVSFEQAGMQLELARPARFELTLWFIAGSPGDAGAEHAPERLYWFDPRQGAFVERGEVIIEERVARGAIDRGGWWAIGRPQADQGATCQRVRVQDESGAPLARAAIRLGSSAGFESVYLFTGDDGSVCWQAAGESTVAMLALGAAASGLAFVQESFWSALAPTPGTCGDTPDTCAQPAPLVARSLPRACVRGAIASLLESSVLWGALFSTPCRMKRAARHRASTTRST